MQCGGRVQPCGGAQGVWMPARAHLKKLDPFPTLLRCDMALAARCAETPCSTPAAAAADAKLEPAPAMCPACCCGGGSGAGCSPADDLPSIADAVQGPSELSPPLLTLNGPPAFPRSLHTSPLVGDRPASGDSTPP